MIDTGIIASAYGEMTRRAMGVDMGAASDSTANFKMAGPHSEGHGISTHTVTAIKQIEGIGLARVHPFGRRGDLFAMSF